MAGGNVFAVTFHCMAEGDTFCQQHDMTDRMVRGRGNLLTTSVFYVLYLYKTLTFLSVFN